jgi:hypothetical protein
MKKAFEAHFKSRFEPRLIVALALRAGKGKSKISWTKSATLNI